MKQILNFIIICSVVFMSFTNPDQNDIWLEELDLSLMSSGWGTPQINKSITGKPLSIAGKKFQHGIGTHAESTLLINLGGSGKKLVAKVGVDDAACETASIIFHVMGDKKILWESGLMKKGDLPKNIDIDISGIKKIGLLVTDGGNGKICDHADWADAHILFTGQKPKTIDNESKTQAQKKDKILTPLAPASPRINGPKTYGVHPGSPFLYRIPVTGNRPMTFTAKRLPDGLQIDKVTGIITGQIEKAGKYPVELVAKNAKGESKREFIIVVGDVLSLTPSMGWNSWYIYYSNVSDSLMRLSADVMISSGMADYGYSYVNIDDCWGVKGGSDDPIIGGPMRTINGKILSNKKFPNMNALTEYIHSKGLKAGIYSSPGPLTCVHNTGSFQHEKQDAETFADWGFDFLKYDWCSYVATSNTLEAKKYPYKLMWNEVKKQKRDIVFNLCQYGMGDVWKWGADMGNSWRTTGDLGSASKNNSLPGFYQIGLSNAAHWEYAHPGAWNDPDYLLIGNIGAINGKISIKTNLTQDEQYAYMSMWSLMASPLIFSGDMAKLDPFTVNILCNNEVIDIDQDVLGHQAKIVKNDKNGLVLVRDLEDNAKAVGLFNYPNANKSENLIDYFLWDSNAKVNLPKKMTINPSEMGITGKYKVRDVWRQKDLGVFENNFEIEVPYHGAAFLKISQ